MLRDVECKCEIVKNFAPSWFASVMGTGITAVTSEFYSNRIPALHYLALGLFYFNIVLFTTLLVPWTLRWIFYREDAKKDLVHPVISNFYPTISVAMLVLSGNIFMFWGSDGKLLAELLWFIGALATVFFSLYIPYIVFSGEHVKIDHINPGWFIPPVGLIVIPIAGAKVYTALPAGVLKESVLLLNIFGWGAGFFIYLALLAVVMYRFILHHPLPNVLAPTVWINLGPIGAGTMSLLALLNTLGASGGTVSGPVYGSITLFAVFFWSFGIWWLVMAIALTIHYIKNLSLPYSLAWWAFTFPLGAYVGATHLVAGVLKSDVVDLFGLSIYFLLLSLWTTTAVRTAMYTYHGTVFRR